MTLALVVGPPNNFNPATALLNDMAQKYLVTKDVLKEFDLIELKLKTPIQVEEYMAARDFFLQAPGEHIQSISEGCL